MEFYLLIFLDGRTFGVGYLNASHYVGREGKCIHARREYHPQMIEWSLGEFAVKERENHVGLCSISFLTTGATRVVRRIGKDFRFLDTAFKT